MIQFFPYVVTLIQLAAGLVYAWHGEWRLAAIWLPLALSNAAFAGIR